MSGLDIEDDGSDSEESTESIIESICQNLIPSLSKGTPESFIPVD